MSLSKTDKEFIRLVMKEEIGDALQPIVEKNSKQDESLQKHEQSLYGTSGTNGISGDMKTIKKKVEELDGTKKQLIAWAAGVSAAVSTAALFVKSFIKGG